RLRLPADPVVRPRRRSARDDEHGAAVSGRVSAEGSRVGRRFHARRRPDGSALRDRVSRLPARGRHHQGHDPLTMLSALVLTLALFQPPAPEIITAIQIHGNTATPDEEIRRLAGVEVGAPLEPTTIEDVAARLRATRRFQSVQVLKRYASIADLSQ